MEGDRVRRTEVVNEVPVTLGMPFDARALLLNSPRLLAYQQQENATTLGYSLLSPSSVVAIGEKFEVTITITDTHAARLESLHVAIRQVFSFSNDLKVPHSVSFRRPLSEIKESFSHLKITRGKTDPLLRRFFLKIDPLLAHHTFESAVISCKATLRLQITLDDPVEIIVKDFPIVIVPASGEFPGSSPAELLGNTSYISLNETASDTSDGDHSLRNKTSFMMSPQTSPISQPGRMPST
ncbi:UNVERIFIED_CONTAM: hypothetical protein HDU68_010222, partial [Siphonaria sp. JEL0065]